MRNLYAGLEATVRIRCGTTDWFKIGIKSVVCAGVGVTGAGAPTGGSGAGTGGIDRKSVV